MSELSRTEVEVMELLIKGLSNKQISVARFTLEQTTKFHLRNIFEKLGVENRVSAAIIYIIWS